MEGKCLDCQCGRKTYEECCSRLVYPSPPRRHINCSFSWSVMVIHLCWLEPGFYHATDYLFGRRSTHIPEYASHKYARFTQIFYPRSSICIIGTLEKIVKPVSKIASILLSKIALKFLLFVFPNENLITGLILVNVPWITWNLVLPKYLFPT